MKKKLLHGVLFSIFALTFIACDKDDNNDDGSWKAPEITRTGAYVLNSGTNNDATLSYYNSDRNIITTDVFYNMNDSLKLGDQAQDMLIYGSKMYITVTNSNKIFVTDRSAKLLSTISPTNNGQPMKPRSLKAYDGKVYASAYSGHVLKVDTTSMAYESVKIGSYPEQMTIVNGNLYIANSGWGNDSTISVVNLTSFTETSKIKVIINPVAITNDESGNLYVVSQGYYGKIDPTLQKINMTTGAISTIGVNIATSLNINGNKLYLLYNDYVNATKLSYYDIAKGVVVNENFVTPTSQTDFTRAYSMSVNPTNGEIYIATGSSSEKGKVYRFSSDGKYKASFASGGYYPMGVYFFPN